MLRVEGLVKTFKKASNPTLKDINFVVDNGEVFGLIGKNGAGKSTTIKCITGVLPFEKGKIVVNTYDVVKKPKKAKSIIGYVPDNHAVYENLTGREYVNFMADIYQVKLQDREKRIKRYSKLLNIEDALDMQISGYSHGMHQKICIMGALVHEPKLWILDEPFLGLDVQSVQIVKDCINDYSKNKKHMVMLTTHNLDTVIELCDRVCVIDKGEVRAVLNMKEPESARKLLKLMNN